MNQYALLKVLHIAGVFLILMPLAALILHRINGGNREQPWRRIVAMTHGVGMLLVVLCGFAMLPILSIRGALPGWVIVKIVIWLLLGGMIGVVLRTGGVWAKVLWWVTPLLGIIAAYMAVVKPF